MILKPIKSTPGIILKKKLENHQRALSSQNFKTKHLNEDIFTSCTHYRITFSGWQISVLEERFRIEKYLSPLERAALAKKINITDQQVKIWFQNRRTRWKRQENVTNEQAKSLMRLKNNQKLQELFKPPPSSSVHTKRILTKDGVILKVQSPPSSPLLSSPPLSSLHVDPSSLLSK